MANLDLYIDATAQQAVSGFANNSIFTIPPFTQEDTLNLRIRLMTRTATFPVNPYSYIPNTGLTLEVALGTKQGSGGTLYTQQFTWALNTDLSDPYFYASLPLNTSPIATLLGVNSSATAFFEIKYISGGVPTTVLSQQVTIQACVIHVGSLTVPAGLTPLSAEAAAAIFLQRTIIGPITLVNAIDQTKKCSVYVDTDGSFHADPIT